jgi:hypothetical protein
MIGSNRLVLGIVHRVQVREEYFDQETLRVRGDRFHPVGRMSVPNWYCKTGDLFEMIRPK